MAKLNQHFTATSSVLTKLLKDPLWLILLAVTSFSYYIVDDALGYFLTTVLLVFCGNVIHQTYFLETIPLKAKIAKELSKFNEDYVVLSSIEFSDSGLRGYSDFLIISPKGIFSLRTLNFEGIITGYENEEFWEYVKATSPYDVVKKIVKNPVYFHLKTQQIIEALLEQQHIKYIPIQSLVVINDNLTVNTDCKIPIVKVGDLYEYILEYADRSIMTSLKLTIEEILLKSIGSNTSYIPMSTK